MTPSDLEALCAVMRKNYVIKCGDVVLSPLAFGAQSWDANEASGPTPIGPAVGMPTDEELLYASCPYPMTKDEIESKKQSLVAVNG